MHTITARAVYKDGVLKPITELDLPEGTAVEVQITTLPLAEISTPVAFGSLAGILNLSEIELEDIERDLAAIRRQTMERIERLAQELDQNVDENHG